MDGGKKSKLQKEIYTGALTITNGPTLLQTNTAPLACKLQLSTDVDSRVSVAVTNAQNSWTKDFYDYSTTDYSTTHSLVLLGFKPDQTNRITITVHDKLLNQTTVTNPLVFTTAPLPVDFPRVVLLSSQPDRMEPGYTLLRAHNNGSQFYVIIVNNQGEVVWYSSSSQSGLDVRQLPDGNLFGYLSTGFYEFNLFGETVQSWTAASGLAVDAHEGFPTDYGTILYLGGGQIDTVTNFPGSSTISNAPTHTVTVTHQPVVEISATNSALLNVWRVIDMLNPQRVTYFYNGSSNNVDWEHANAVIKDPRDNSIIVSMRHQNAVIKFSRTNGQLKWILGSPENWGPNLQQYLLTPVGAPFQWNFAQHAPKITPQGTLLIYDDGNFRANPFNPPVADTNNYSRAVEYSINENTMEVSQVWEYGGSIPERLYTPTVGDVEWLPQTTNVLVAFANVSLVNGKSPSQYSASAKMIRIKELTHAQPAEVVFDLQLFNSTNTSPSYAGCSGYRSYRIPDLYPNPYLPVQDLTGTFANGNVKLQCAGNPYQKNRVEASTNLLQWQDIGAAILDQGSGQLTFTDVQVNNLPMRYYRIVSSPL